MPFNEDGTPSMPPWQWAEIIVGQAEESMLRARCLPKIARTYDQYRRGILTTFELVQKLYEEIVAEAQSMWEATQDNPPPTEG